jgi:agmatinase
VTREPRDAFTDAPEPMYGFAGIPSFLRAPIARYGIDADAEIGILGVPADFGSPFMPGSRFGPRGIREHSLRFGASGYYDQRQDRTFLAEEVRGRRIVDAGDVDVLPNNIHLSFDRTTTAVRSLVDAGLLPVVLGGDHSISFPVVRALERPLHVVHFDAHIDYSPFIHGFGPTNMTPFRFIRQLPQVQSLLQVGIRSIRNSQAFVDDSRTDGNRVLGIDETRDLGRTGMAEMLPDGAPVYVSIDIDVLDLPLVPGCVSAEPEGFRYAELRDQLQALAERCEIVGFDLVEVNPQLDVATGITSYLAAHTIVEFLGAITTQPWYRERRRTAAEQRAGAAGGTEQQR